MDGEDCLRALSHVTGVPYSDGKANRDFRDFGWEIAHGAVSRRPPISFDTIVARTGATHTTLGLGFVRHSRTILCRAVHRPS
jgi:hypothetical protein